MARTAVLLAQERSGPWPGWLLALTITLGLPTAFSATSCLHHYCDDDDFGDNDDCHQDDDDFHDDDDFFSARIGGGGEHPYALEDYELVQSTGPNQHPVAALLRVRGVNLFHPEGPAGSGDKSYEELTGILIDTNRELVGLPHDAGRLAFDAVLFEADGFRVQFDQETKRLDGSWRVVEGAQLVFEFGTAGDLLEVHNSTWLEPPR